MSISNLSELLSHNAATYPQRPAFIEDDQIVTHGAFFSECRVLAAGLRSAGLQSGDRISLLAHNGLGFVRLLGAAIHMGAVLSPINWRLSPDEVKKVIVNDQPAIIFVGSALAPLLKNVISEMLPLPRLVALDGNLEGFERFQDLFSTTGFATDAKRQPDVPAVFIHTAWTDGRPKAAMLTQRNLLIGAMQLSGRWLLDPSDVHLCMLPLFHITALTMMLAVACAGGCSVLQSRFDPEKSLKKIAQHGVTVFGEFAPMLDTLLKLEEAPVRMATVRHVCGLDSPEVIERFQAIFPKAIFWVAYGQSEAGGVVTVAPFLEAAKSAGYPFPNSSIAILGEDEQQVHLGGSGEIAIRSPTVFAGYWGRESESEHVLRNGWLHTGDLGRLDAQGRLVYLGRLPEKELIKSGGENVYPAEVEKVLLEHPAVVDAAVIGVPDAQWGESVRAICQVRGAVSAQMLIDHVGTKIASYKRPKTVVIAEWIPRKPDGSKDREEIKARFGASGN